MNTETNAIAQLLEIMRRLRDPATGCAWDIKQSFSTIAPFTIEEAYEVADAIERNDLDDLKDELGDLLFQVVFHAQMASESGEFNFNDVAQSIVEKMIRRHPHVFGSVVYETEEELKIAWEAIKSRERLAKLARKAAIGANSYPRSQADAQSESEQVRAASKPANTPANSQQDNNAELHSNELNTAGTAFLQPGSALDGVAANLPALKRADKLQKRAARVGFDWSEPAPVWDKLNEEINEVKAAIASGQSDAIEDELGDLLFTVVNLARHSAVDSEQALRRATVKFDKRFRRVEALAGEQGLALDGLDDTQLDALWEKAKLQLHTQDC